MKKLLLILTTFISFTTKAQIADYGLTARAGVFKTITNNEIRYGIGQQLMVGAWAKLSLTQKSQLQVTLLQVGERQGAGEITFIDGNNNPFVDAAVTHYNLAAVLQAVYLYRFSEKWSAGVGAGAKHEYLSKSKVKADDENAYMQVKFKETYDNHYRRDVLVHLPVELQYTYNDHLTWVGQLQIPVSNRLGASETNYTERDVSVTIGVNYKL